MENLVGYGKDDLLTPLLLELAPAEPAGRAATGVGGDGRDRQRHAAAIILADLPAANARAQAVV